MLKKSNIQDIYPLSSMQEGLLFHTLLDRTPGAYIEQSVITINGDVDSSLLESSFNRLIQRHDVLRTVFSYKKSKKPMQVLLKEREFRLDLRDLSHLNPTDAAAFIDDFREKDKTRGFDLTSDLLLRVSLVKTGGSSYSLIWTYHHIIMDGWCIGILYSELVSIYRSLRNGTHPQLGAVTPYSRFIARIGEYDKEEALAYWREYLRSYETRAALPEPPVEGEKGEFRREEMAFSINETGSRELTGIARDSQVTLSTVIQVLWGVLLQVCGNTRDVVFGSVISLRPSDIEGIETMVGLFLNTVPVRVRTENGETFLQLLRRSWEEAAASKMHEYLPLVDIQSCSPLKNDLLHHVVSFQNFPVQEVLKRDGGEEELGFRIEGMESFEQTHYDFVVNVSPEEQVSVKFTYNSVVYPAAFIRRIAGYFETLVLRVIESPGTPLEAIEILSPLEKERLLYHLNSTAHNVSWPYHKTIHRLFEDQTLKHPDRIALLESNRSYFSYSRLNRAANQCATLLQEKGLRPGAIAALLIERSFEMIAGILAVLKAGGAYLPIDPEYPEDRIRYMLEDSGAKVLLKKSGPGSNDRIGINTPVVLNFENLDFEKGCPCQGLVSNFGFRASDFSPSDISYVIYTSGTTGRPKGVLIEHRNVVRLLFNDKFQFNFSPDDVWSMFHSYCFDFSVWEMYGALLYGGKLVLVSRDHARDPGRFLEIARQEGVTVLNQTPSAFYNFISEELKRSDAALQIRYVVFGGEALAPGRLKQWKEKYPRTRLINMFGITETTVHVTFKEIGHREIDGNISNIGVPIPTLSTYIMDPGLRLVPAGTPGELNVGGEGVGRGYLNRPELTSERFVQNPYKPGERLYRSGDLARIIGDPLAGEIEMEYMGRIDQQVKIRGFRVELGEIQAELLKHPQIKEAVVIARSSGESRDTVLCAYFVSSGSLDLEQLRGFLSRQLPPYMIPAYFVPLEKIPLTVNGKLNRAALPDPGETAVRSGEEYIAPADQIEETLRDAWKEVLELERVGITDNFFTVGGDSIKTIRLISVINAKFQSAFKVADVYTHQSIREFAPLIRDGAGVPYPNKELEEAGKEIEELKLRLLSAHQREIGEDAEDIFPMSDIENGMIYHTVKEPERVLYHEQFAYQVSYDNFSIETFTRAVELMMEKHSILRASYNIDQFEVPVQILRRDVRPDIVYQDISDRPRSQQEEFVLRFMEEDRNRPFNVTRAPLWRMRLFALGNKELLILWIFHHAVLDGWSNASLMTELNNTYLRLRTEPLYIPPPIRCTYKDYIVRQEAEKKDSRSIQYWKSVLEDYRRIDFSGFTGRPGVDNPDQGKQKIVRELGESLSRRLAGTARAYRTSVKNLCFAAYAYMLGMLSYHGDIVVGLVSNLRPACEDGDKLVGCFLNTLPVRIRIPHPSTWGDYIRLVDRTLVELKNYERVSLFEIMRISGETGRDGNPLFDAIFNYIDFHVFRQVDAGVTAGDWLQLEPYENTNTLFDFTVNTTLGAFEINLQYSPRLVGHDAVQSMLRYFEVALESLASGDRLESVIDKEQFLAPEEKKKLLYEFNADDTPDLSRKTIHRLFEEQAFEHPDRIAIHESDRSHVSYSRLDRHSNPLAVVLREKGVQTGSVVGIMVERSIRLITGLLAILKAGGAYLPIEPGYPEDRVRYMLEDSGAKLLLINSEKDLNRWNRSYSPVVLNLENLDFEKGCPCQGLVSDFGFRASNFSPSSLAYILYTSGTTGKPRGVMIEHRNIAALVVNSNFIRFQSNDRLLLTGAIVFDITTFEIWGPLLNRSTLFLIHKDVVLDGEKLGEAIRRNRITILHLVPQLFNRLADRFPSIFQGLRYFLVGGDLVRPFYVNKIRALYKDLKILHMYGPTENTVFSTFFPVESDHDVSIPIGSPVSNSTVTIVDKYRRLVPIGAAGELCVGGARVARGYLNNPDLTIERFNRSNRSYRTYTLYLTGDLARWRPDGTLEFLGRIDRQVKIRGIRVELEEIESLLLNHPKIGDAVVTAGGSGDSGDSYLCAYYVTPGGITVEDVREYLSRRLPAAVVPSYFMPLEKMPLTPNGKVDRKALPVPEAGSGSQYIAPRDEVETELTRIWADALKITSPIGIDDNFFRLGGHSLRAVRVVSEIHKRLGIKISLSQLFQSATIREIREFSRGLMRDVFKPLEPAEKKEYYPLTAAQKRMYFVEHITRDLSYNMPHVFRIEGAPDLSRLEASFQQLIRRHEGFRTGFQVIRDKLVQIVHPFERISFHIEYYEAGETGARRMVEDFVRLFDLSKPPLLRVQVIKVGEGRYIFMADMHHIINDGISTELMGREIGRLYTGEELPDVKIQYKDYAEWQNSAGQKVAVKQQEAFWLKTLGGELPVLNLPLDFPRPAVQDFQADTVEFTIGSEETVALKELASGERVTLYIAFLALYNVLLSALTGQEDILVGTFLGARRHDDLNKIIGMFVSTLVFRSFPAAGKTFRSYIHEAARMTLDSFENQQFEFDELVERLGVPRDISRNPLFDVMFQFGDFGEREDASIDVRSPGFRIEPYDQYQYLLAKFDLALFGVTDQDRMRFVFRYCVKLFKKETVRQFARYFERLVAVIARDPDILLGDIDLLSHRERQQLLEEFNRTDAPFPGEKTIHRIFEEQALKTPDRVSIYMSNRSYGSHLTYTELNRQSILHAFSLRERGVGPDTIAAIMMERSVDMVIGILSILKAGGAYLPIDPDYPEDRIDYMLEDSGAKVLLKKSGMDSSDRKGINAPVVLNFENSDFEFVSNFGFRASDLPPAGLAYIIYTSGSTGRPKGVIVQHRSVVNLLSALARTYPLDENGRYLLKTPFIFDVSVSELFGWFWGGGRLVILEDELHKDPFAILDIVRRTAVTHINFVPSMFNAFLEILEREGVRKIESLKYIFLAGEALSPSLITRFRELNSRVLLENLYGPTEATVYSSGYSLAPWDSRDKMSIGRPLQNMKLFILNNRRRLKPVGIAGELHISGEGIALGYLNNPELTADRFYRSNRSYGSYRTYTTYRTGDLARWLPDGNIEFLGRIDRQVKIRGFRIELGEIESRLAGHPSVREAVVIDRTRGGSASFETYLCAYIVPAAVSGTVIDIPRLRDFLSAVLPEYMVPSFFVPMDRIPVTTGGKVDRRALPEPAAVDTAAEYTSPAGETEETLAQIWSELLEIEKERISANANFFHLGGHSLKATILIARIHKHFNVAVPMVEMFKTPTIRQLARTIGEMETRSFTSIPSVEKREYYPLSSAQERLYVLQQMDTGSTVYNLFYGVGIRGKIENAKLENVFNTLIRRHESLRTSFIMVNEHPVQLVHNTVPFEIEFIEGERSSAVSQFIRPFFLTQAPLLRVGFVQEREDSCFLMLDMHHIITDGTSQALFVREFTALYSGEELERLDIHYKDYALWQRSETEKARLKRQENYWHNQFRREVTVLELPLDFPRPAVQSFDGRVIGFEIDSPETARLKELADRYGVTLYMLLMGIFNIFLAKLTGCDDIVVGAPIAGRRHAELEPVIGMFVNTLALRNHPSSQKTFIDFMKDVREQILHAFENQEYPFEDLVEKISVTRDPGHNPLFDIVFLLQNVSSEKTDVPGLQLEPYINEITTAKFDLTMMGVETGESIYLTFEYCTRLFREATVRRFTRYFKNIVRSVLDNPARALSGIEIISEEEKEQILYRFNDTRVPYPHDTTIHQLFREQVGKTPGKAAVVFEGETLTYRELDRRSDLMASILTHSGIDIETVVGIMLPRSIDMVLAVLAVLKAGGAYLPINIDYPEERINYMLADSNANVLLINSEMAFNSRNRNYSPVVLNFEHSNFEFVSNFEFRASDFSSSHLAYIIYTSGTTGKPKGTIVEHRNVVRLVKNSNFVDFNREERLLQTGALEFDASTFEIWGSLLNGWTLFLADRDKIVSASLLKETVRKYAVSIIWLTSPLFNQLCRADVGVFKGLRYLLVGGDILSPPDIARVRQTYPSLKVINGYGPTENTTFSTTHLIEGDYAGGIPIGRPIANSTAYIVDSSGYLQPVGVPGELHVGGDGVSRGYLNAPELTAERFYRSHRSNRSYFFYRTGDLARWLADGTIEFLGRIDRQVKIRGFRVELGEIENCLLKLPHIEEAVVVDVQRDEKYLCAYIVTSQDIDIPGLRGALSPMLPEYMIPSYFVRIEQIPLTPNGKVDRRALPLPEVPRRDDYTPPENEIQEKLVRIWADILNIDLHESPIGIDQDFFLLGGHSLKATILTARIHKDYEVQISLTDIFTCPTVRELSRFISSARIEQFTSIPAVEEKEYYILSSAQKRLYILQQMELDGTAYNVPMKAVLEGFLDKERFVDTFRKLIDRHESLRTSFHLIDGEPVQKIHRRVKFEIDHSDPAHQINRPFDLSHVPLIRVGLKRESETKHILFMDIHHIVTDGTSQSVFIREFMTLYSGQNLPPLNIQYKEYAEWQNREKERMKSREEYWINIFQGELPVLELPVDHSRPTVQRFDGSTIDFQLNREDVYRLRQLAARQGVTTFMLLLGIFYVLLSKLSGQEDIVVGTPIAGRKHAEVTSVVGMFVNTLALRNCPSGEMRFIDFLDHIKDSSLKAFENQEYQFEDLVEIVSAPRDAGRNPIFDVMFSVQNDSDHPSVDIRDFKIVPYGNKSGISKFDLTLKASETGDDLFFTFNYSANLFKRETVERFAAYFKRAASGAASDPSVPISEIDIIDDIEKYRLLVEFNRTDTPYAKDKTIHRLFVEQAEKSPDRIAIQSSPRTHLTYKELDRASDRTACLLHERACRPGSIVGISTGPSFSMIIGIIAVLKAGACYLPIDPGSPRERVNYMLADSDAAFLLTEEEINAFKDQHTRFHTPPNSCSPDLAYIIYTSGTTGKPKGVPVTHQSLVNYVNWFSTAARLTGEDKTALTSSFAFDLGYTSLYTSILTGAQLHILARETYMMPGSFLEHIRREGITYLKMTPSLFSVIVSNPLFTEEICRRLRLVVLGGEAVMVADVERAFRMFSRLEIMNHYGPTEVTIGCAAQFIDRNNINAYKARPTIGRPIFNTKAFILDKYLKLVPTAVAGELCFSGDGVSIGYLNRPELTAEKFNRSNRSYRTYITYKTGDLARWNSSGCIEFLGRIDHQVKIRGYRIELGEIESRLLEHPEITDAAVLVLTGNAGARSLCAYVVGTADVSGLKNHLSLALPEYMVPTYFVPLEKLPLTPNGKLDRKALPLPEAAVSTEYIAPRDAVQAKLVEIWSEILRVDGGKTGINTNFFEAGGNSLSAVIMLSRCHKEFDVKIPLAEVFKTPTILGLSGFIDKAAEDPYASIEPVEKKEFYPLSSAQNRVYFLQQMDLQSTAYNMPRLIPLPETPDIERLESSFLRLIERHESLRTSFGTAAGEPIQQIHEKVEFKIDYLDSLPLTHRPFDLSRAPLLRVGLIKTEDGNYLLFIDMHHIISDGLSRLILEKDFNTFYKGETLPPLRIQYKDFAQWQRSENHKQAMKQQEAYWVGQFEDSVPGSNLPTDHPRPKVQRFEGSILSGEIACDIDALKNLVLENGATPFILFLALYNIFLSKISGQDDIVIGTPVSGRNHDDLQQVMGMFVNTLALRNRPAREKTFIEFLNEVKSNTLKAFNNQDYQFDDLVEKIAGNRAGHNPIFDVMFQFQEIQRDPQTEDAPGTLSDHPTLPHTTAKFDLNLNVVIGNGLFYSFEYSTALFIEKTVERFSDIFKEIVFSVLNDISIKLKDIEFTSGFADGNLGDMEKELKDMEF